ncbi:MAG: hypothetical protein CMI01_02655 [Oceanospirillaceae bacterium]|nr:hypothetical protein [Oceanospirillaceae bacterium]
MTASPLQHALQLLQRQSFDQAAALCQQVLKANPKDFNAQHLLGVIQMQSGNLDEACASLKVASQMSVASRYKAQALSNLSLALKQNDALGDALIAVEQAITLLPDELAFRVNRLNILELEQQWDLIVKATAETPALNQEPELQCLLARAERHSGKAQAALKRIEQYLQQTPGDLEALGEWALLRAALGDQAILEQALELAPAETLEWIADYLAEEGWLTQALPLYRSLLRNDPGHTGARHMLDAAEGRLTEAAPAAYIESLYDAHAHRFEQHLVKRLEYRAPTRLAERLAKHIQGPLDQVADLGCGSGLMGEALRARFEISRLSGCDLSGGMLSIAEQNGYYDQLAQGQVTEWLAQHPRHFEVICATDLLIYFGDLAPLMELAAQALIPDGLFAFTVEHADQGLALTASGRYRHSLDHIQTRCDQAGLALIEQETFALRKEQGKIITGTLIIARLHPQQTQSGEDA